jgi:hypothetical protein
MNYRYGEFTRDQISETKKRLRKKIFFLLLYADPNKADEYKNVNIDEAIESALRLVGGFNDLLGCPQEVVTIQSLLDAALIEHRKADFDWKIYRKLILDAGNKVETIKEV